MKKKYKFLMNYDAHKKDAVVEFTEEEAKNLLLIKVVEPVDPEDDDEGDVSEELKSVTEEFREAIAGVVKDVLEGATKTLTVSGQKISVGKSREEDDPMVGYRDYGQFALDVKNFNQNRISEQMVKYFKVREAQAKAYGMSESVGEDGGVLVPTEMSAEIYRLAFPDGDLMSRTTQRTISGNSISYNSMLENSRASGQRHGGVRGYWVGEGVQMTKSKPKYTKVKMELNKLAVLCYVTEELLEDAGINLQAELTDLASKEIRFLVDDSLINGDGVAKPKGVLNAGCKIAVTRTTANKVKATDINNMWARMPGFLRANSVWLINQEVEPQLEAMFIPVTNVAGTENVGGWPLYLPPGGIADAPYGRLKGRPVIPVEYCAALGTEGDIILANMSEYRTIKKGGVKTAMSMHLRFDYDEQAFRFTFRVDGQSMWPSAITPYKGTNTLSHIVSVAA